ncbi:MAG TPA: cytochrome c [Bryobacteraceae bacterium]|nr:cytochrome c [Bryobacteraceae bacterium]
MSDQEQDKDPVVTSSLSKQLFIWSALLLLSLGWALYDEIYGIRPWKSYESRFAKIYTQYLRRIRPSEARFEKEVKASPDYQKLDRDMQGAEKAVASQVAEIDRKVNQELVPRILALNDPFQEVRSHIGALTYQIETSSSESSKDSMRKEIDELKREVHTVKLPLPDGTIEKKSMNFDQMDQTLQDWKKEKARLLQQRVEILKPATELRATRDKYVSDRIADVSAETLAGLTTKMANFNIQIRQIHIKDVELVDRCESCHLGTREPVELTKAAMGGEAVFVSHPNRELLKIHDPEKFGCTPCHGGNGVAVDSVTKAHGRHKFWLWPLHYRENFEAGCQQCHVREIVTEMADTLNAGRETFRLRGCMGCHRYEGFDREPDEMTSVTQQVRQLEQQKAEWTREIGFTTDKADRTRDNAEAQRLYQHANDLKVRITGLDAKIEQADIRSSDLVREVKKVGPSLKEVRMKMHKEWIPVWLQDPHKWRPGTKMPTFRLDQDDIKAIAAFIWQSGVTGVLPSQPPGDPVKGKEAFETRGCMACHSMGEGNEKQGGAFAANLSRVGEKDNYNYLVRWIHNPRERSLPYCPFEKRDLTAEDYKKKGLPFVFDMDHDKCPNDGHQLQVEQMTPMPSLRLTVEEARDIASYLMTRKHEGATYAAADYLDDPKLKDRGVFLVRYYGCAGCHEIAGLEEEQRIGTELTKEGSKPLERLDFALLGHEAEREGWYTHKGFFEHKLENPAVYDQGKEKPNKFDRLKMPNFNLSKPEIDQVATFLLGSVDSTMPDRYHYLPSDQRQDIVEGWWVIRKYNCMGCHQVHVGQTTVFMGLPRYQDPDWKDQKPPSLIGEGARVNPAWLMRFLANPSMSDSDTNRDGVRQYLKARMPTFYFSNGEIQKLVRFFAAMSSQAAPYIAPKMEVVSDQERTMARQLFSSEGAPCLKCHMTGDVKHDARATAPNFLLAKERLKPGWTERWIVHPEMMAPGTAMPSGLFRREGERWVFAGPTPASFQNYPRDHAGLLVRYMFQFTPAELNRLRASAGAGAGR